MENRWDGEHSDDSIGIYDCAVVNYEYESLKHENGMRLFGGLLFDI